jgi:hypothetical protein
MGLNPKGQNLMVSPATLVWTGVDGVLVTDAHGMTRRVASRDIRHPRFDAELNVH